MIMLPLDEAFALDYLSILLVKRDNGLPVQPEIDRIEAFLRPQLSRYDEILMSIAFKRLTVANQKTFDAIEAAHRNAITAREVQQINYSRFDAKRALQAQFWPQSAMSERKTRLTRRH
jgi:hypothetical protein